LLRGHFEGMPAWTTLAFRNRQVKGDPNGLNEHMDEWMRYGNYCGVHAQSPDGLGTACSSSNGLSTTLAKGSHHFEVCDDCGLDTSCALQNMAVVRDIERNLEEGPEFGNGFSRFGNHMCAADASYMEYMKSTSQGCFKNFADGFGVPENAYRKLATCTMIFTPCINYDGPHISVMCQANPKHFERCKQTSKLLNSFIVCLAVPYLKYRAPLADYNLKQKCDPLDAKCFAAEDARNPPASDVSDQMAPTEPLGEQTQTNTTSLVQRSLHKDSATKHRNSQTALSCGPFFTDNREHTLLLCQLIARKVVSTATQVSRDPRELEDESDESDSSSFLKIAYNDPVMTVNLEPSGQNGPRKYTVGNKGFAVLRDDAVCNVDALIFTWPLTREEVKAVAADVNQSIAEAAYDAAHPAHMERRRRSSKKDTPQPTTPEPTTPSPTTPSPTQAPSTQSPTTPAPTTPAPTTPAPTTPAPTIAPTTPAPTIAPTTPSPTVAPTTPSPTTPSPTTPSPTIIPPMPLGCFRDSYEGHQNGLLRYRLLKGMQRGAAYDVTIYSCGDFCLRYPEAKELAGPNTPEIPDPDMPGDPHYEEYKEQGLLYQSSRPFQYMGVTTVRTLVPCVNETDCEDGIRIQVTNNCFCGNTDLSFSGGTFKDTFVDDKGKDGACNQRCKYSEEDSDNYCGGFEDSAAGGYTTLMSVYKVYKAR